MPNQRIWTFTLDFSAVADPVGAVLELDGQRYTVVGLRQDGERVLIVWQAPCATCGKPFEWASLRDHTRWLSRRCPEHRQPGRPVHREARP